MKPFTKMLLYKLADCVSFYWSLANFIEYSRILHSLPLITGYLISFKAFVTIEEHYMLQSITMLLILEGHKGIVEIFEKWSSKNLSTDNLPLNDDFTRSNIFLKAVIKFNVGSVLWQISYID